MDGAAALAALAAMCTGSCAQWIERLVAAALGRWGVETDAAIIIVFLFFPCFFIARITAGERCNTFVGLKLPMISDVAPVLGMLERVMLRDVVGATPFAGDESGRSMSIGVDAMARGKKGR